MTQRPLPTVIGPTETALRSLLVRVLASTGINGYHEWVALNLTNNHGTAAVTALAAALDLQINTAKEILDRLAERGLITGSELTAVGQSELQHARDAVGSATATLVAHIDEEHQETTRAVLDTIRSRAEQALLGA